MTKRNFAIAAGAFVMAIGGFLAGKANLKFTTLSKLYYQKSASVCQVISPTSIAQVFTTTTPTAANAIKFLTSGATAVSVFTSSNGTTCSNAVSVSLIP